MRNIIIPIAVVILMTGGYFLYKNITSSQRIDIWEIVPENAIGVYELNRKNESRIKQDTINTVSSIIAYAYQFIKNKSVDVNDSSLLSKDLELLLTESNMLISANVIGNKDLDLTFFADLKGNSIINRLRKYLENVKKNFSLVENTRIYKDVSIYELTNDHITYSYVIYDSYFIGSFTPFLVEDAIRTVIDKQALSFKEVNGELFSISKLTNDDGNIYVNGAKFQDVLQVFLSTNVYHKAYKSAFYDLNVSSDQVLMNGFSYVTSGKEYFLTPSNNQTPKPIKVKRYIPNNTSFLYHLGIDNTQEWLRNSFGQNEIVQLDSSANILYDRTKITRWLGDEIALVELESNKIEKLMFLDVVDMNEGLNQLNTLAEQAVEAIGDTLYYEYFADHLIKELRINNFPEKVFGSMFSGFEDCYYTTMDNYFVLSNSVEGIKILINENEKENTWGKSVDKSRFLQSTMEEANISIFFDVNKVWGRLLNLLNDTWRGVFEKNDFAFRKFQMGAIQFSNIDNKYYSSIVLKKTGEANTLIKRGTFDVEKTTYLESIAVTKPFIVRNHMKGGFETMIQDSLTKLYLISNEGEILWTDSIGETIVDNVVQIDYYKNKKLQYFFATTTQLHLIDRNGEYVEGFPYQLGFEAEYSSVLDYDNSKRYRFLIGNKRGDLYIFDKNLTNLEGWRPKVLTGPLSVRAEHIRVRGKDMIVASESEGKINVLNRLGIPYPGFPLEFDFSLKSEVFADIGSNFGNSTLNLISPDGELISVNLEGEVLKRKQFFKPSKETQFKLTTSTDGKSLVIYRYDRSRLSVLDSEDNVIFEKDYLDANITDVQFYNFGVGREVYAVTDSKQQFTYIYNHLGELINYTPINSGFKIGLIDYSSRNKKFIYSVFENNLTVYSY